MQSTCRCGQTCVVEIAVEPNHHRIEWSTVHRPVVDHSDAPAALNRLHDSRATSHENPLTWHDQECSGSGRTDDVAIGTDSDAKECGNLFLDAGSRVVRYEDHSTTRCSKSGNGIGRSRNRLAGQPDHSIKVAQHRAHGTHIVVHHA